METLRDRLLRRLPGLSNNGLLPPPVAGDPSPSQGLNKTDNEDWLVVLSVFLAFILLLMMVLTTLLVARFHIRRRRVSLGTTEQIRGYGHVTLASPPRPGGHATYQYTDSSISTSVSPRSASVT
ncbi:MAG: hypothetical protein MHM6MM_001090 [Cercozoa sp. M6MM]